MLFILAYVVLDQDLTSGTLFNAELGLLNNEGDTNGFREQ